MNFELLELGWKSKLGFSIKPIIIIIIMKSPCFTFSFVSLFKSFSPPSRFVYVLKNSIRMSKSIKRKRNDAPIEEIVIKCEPEDDEVPNNTSSEDLLPMTRRGTRRKPGEFIIKSFVRTIKSHFSLTFSGHPSRRN